MKAEYYQYLSVSNVQCPKCGNPEEVPLQNNRGTGLEYFGVCETVLETGGRCGTTLSLRVTAHLFPESVKET